MRSVDLRLSAGFTLVFTGVRLTAFLLIAAGNAEAGIVSPEHLTLAGIFDPLCGDRWVAFHGATFSGSRGFCLVLPEQHTAVLARDVTATVSAGMGGRRRGLALAERWLLWFCAKAQNLFVLSHREAQERGVPAVGVPALERLSLVKRFGCGRIALV